MKKNKLPSIPYKKFVEQLRFDSMKIVFAKAEVDEQFWTPANIQIDIQSGYQQLPERKINISQKYNLACTKKGDDKPGFTVEVHYVLMYYSEIPISKNLFKHFKQSTLLLQTWPYFRQYVHQMAMQMNLPTLVLDMVKVTG
jgi:preprotein translocase subunit SecB